MSAVGQTNTINHSTPPIKCNYTDFQVAIQSTNRLPAALHFSSGIKQRLDSIITTTISGEYKEKRHFVYNSLGYNTDCLIYRYDETNFKWVQIANVNCSYDSAWHLTSVFSDVGYIPSEEFTYDKNGNLLIRKYDSSQDVYHYNYFPDKIHAIIFDCETTIFYFNPDGKITNIRWAETDSVEFKYNQQGSLLSKTYYYKEAPTCPIVIYDKEDYYYDTTNNTITTLRRYSEFSGYCKDSILNNEFETKYVYDPGFTLNDLILPYDFNFNPATHYLWDSKIWNFLLDFKIVERSSNYYDSHIKYYFSELTITDNYYIKSFESRIYPNPATDNIYFYI